MVNKKLNRVIVVFFVFFSFYVNSNNGNTFLNEENSKLGINDLFETSPIVIDDSGSGDYTWAQAVLQTWCSGSGIWPDPYIIENITIDGDSSGSCIEVRSSTAYFIIRNSVFYGAGLALEDCAGIKFINTDNGKLINNDCSNNNRHGIYLVGSNNNTIMNNTAKFNYWSGIQLETSNDNTILENILEENDNGINFYDECYSNNISNNNITNNNDDGIRIRAYCDFNTIQGNKINDNGGGIYIYYYSNNFEIFDNIITFNTGTGIYLDYHCSNHNIINNIIEHNSGHGVYLESECTYNLIKQNDVIDNYYGVYLYTGSGHYTDNNSIIENNINLNTYGVNTHWVDNTEFYRNNITYNSEYGIYISSYSYDNKIIENNLANNGVNGLDNGIDSVWNNSLIGNYWSDYPGRDINEDGIGDIPYDITGSAGAIDYLPIWDDGIEAPPYFLNDPEPFQMIEGNPSKNITWTPKDDNWNYDSYWIYRNETLIIKESWDGSQIIFTELYTLAPDIYEFTCFVNDTDGAIVSSSVLIEIEYDNIQPIITILNPIQYSLHGITVPPYFEISIEELNLNSIWYSLNDGNNYTITVLSGDIDLNEWNNCGNGTNLIKFFANDTNGNIGINMVNILKDIYTPEITIYSPKINELFGSVSPFFNISIIEPNFQSSNYRLNGGPVYAFSGTSGMINQEAWDACGNGTVIITFEIWDLVGNYIIKDVTVKKDILPPNIIINLPTSLSLYSNNPPYYEIEIIEGNLIETCYSLNGGQNYTFTGNNGIIDQEAWDACGHGPVIIRFYAKDSLNKISFKDISVLKDIVAPEINIFKPDLNEVFGITPPNFNVSIQDNNLNDMWYCLNGGDKNYFSNNNGVINITAWNACLDGVIVISFYANDTLGNLNFEEIQVIKDSTLPEISIHSPTILELFGLKAPYFNISIVNSDLDTSWYSLNDGQNYTITGSIGKFDQDAWDLCGNGTVKISFFANNSAGYMAYDEVIVRKEIRVPIITVISPMVSEVFGVDPFQFEIDIDDPSVYSMWYSLNHGVNYSFSNPIGVISEIEWNICNHGPIILSFYANNTAGNIGTTEIIIYKDIIGPEIIIISPTSNELFGNSTIDFEIYIDDTGLDTTWYALEGGANYIFTGFSDIINQEAWDIYGNGTVSIIFYANDTLGNIGFNEVLVRKDIFIPAIIINLPISNQFCGMISPSYNITVIGTDIHTMWYRVNDTSIHEFTGMTGRIEQEIWDIFGDGMISIKFYANNSVGHYTVEEIWVLKGTSLTERNAYAIIIGISNYPGSNYDLNYCDDDAIGVYNMLVNDYNFKSENIIYLQDSSATKNDINAAFDDIASLVREDDIFFFYYSGHGGHGTYSTQGNWDVDTLHPYWNNYDQIWSVSHPEAVSMRVHFERFQTEANYDYALCGDWSVSQGYYYEMLTGNLGNNFWSGYIPGSRYYIRFISDSSNTGYGFSIDRYEAILEDGTHYLCSYDSIPSNPSAYYMDTLLDSKLNSINCADKYVVLDSCNSGGLIPEVQDIGRYIMTACRATEESLETSLLEHGIFTYFLLESKENANDENGDGVISIEECYSYVYSNTRSYSGSFGSEYRYSPQESDGIDGEAILSPSIGSVWINPVDNQLYYSFYLYGHGLLKTLNITVCSLSPTITFKTEDIKNLIISPTGFGYYSGVIELQEGYTAGGIQIIAEIEGNQLIIINITTGDSDGDGLTDFFEILESGGLDPTSNDTDSDGLNDYDEFYGPTDPLISDTDADGLLDGEEVNLYNTDPTQEDTDLDGLIDGEEVNTHNTDPTQEDTDLDGLIDGEEVNTHDTDPLNSDSDSDTMPDGWEVDNLLDPNTNDGDLDPDNDLLINIFEYGNNTNPQNPDTDSDGLLDGEEVNTHNTDPLLEDTDSDAMPDGWEVDNLLDPNTNDGDLDPDNDLLTNILEYENNTDPQNQDTDSDGLFDGEEVNTYNTDPQNQDTDSDGLLDGEEVNTYNTDPLLEDTDGDGLLDGEEVNTYDTNPSQEDTDSDGLLDGEEVNTHNTDPLLEDTDGDGWSDGEEILIYDTDPLDPDDYPNPGSQNIPGYTLNLVLISIVLISIVWLFKNKRRYSNN